MDWHVVAAITGALGVIGAAWIGSVRIGSRCKVHDALLESHSKAHEEHYAREFETARMMERTTALLDQVEKRVSRIEDHEDSGD